RNLYRMGITTLGQIAEYPLTSLKKRFGIMGEQLYWHAWGIDLSPVFGDFTHTENDSYGHGISLLKDYSREDALICILELCEEVSAGLSHVIYQPILRWKCLKFVVSFFIPFMTESVKSDVYLSP